MISLGKYNNLEILRDTTVGLFLGDDEGNDVLLPNKYVPGEFEIGDFINVFCYLDHEERIVATTLEPYVMVDQFKLLQVAEVNEYGAFMDWGLEKHLLVPFREQRNKMQEGQWYVVYCYLDEKTDRLVASNKLDKFLSNDELSVSVLEKVDLVVTRSTDLGWEAIINNKHKGLIYANEIFKKVAVGDQLDGYIKHIREDNKIDISLQPIGYKSLEPAANLIYRQLLAHDGFLPLHYKADPEDRKRILQKSKKIMKEGIGVLYGERKIKIATGGIQLV